jgi:hypothetical protein
VIQKNRSPRKLTKRRKDRPQSRVTLSGIGLSLLFYAAVLLLVGLATSNLHAVTYVDLTIVAGAGFVALVAGRITSSPVDTPGERIGASQMIALVAAVVTLIAALVPFLGPIARTKNTSGYDVVPLLPCQERNEPLQTRGAPDDSPS